MSKNTKSCKKIIAQKVGRPLKYKKEKLVEAKKDIDFSSDPASSPERYNGTEKSFDAEAHLSSNDEYERNMYQYDNDMRQDMLREEEVGALVTRGRRLSIRIFRGNTGWRRSTIRSTSKS